MCVLERKSHDVVCLYGYVYISENIAVSGSLDSIREHA